MDDLWPYAIESYGGGWIIVDYSGRRGLMGAAYAGVSLGWRSQPIVTDPFPDEAAARKVAESLEPGTNYDEDPDIPKRPEPMVNPLALPPVNAGENVYSNSDHVLNRLVVEALITNRGRWWAGHAGWDFYGSVWVLPDGRWIEQVRRFHVIVDEFISNRVEGVIEAVNGKYGTR